jgi:hypothetical protein
MKTCRRSRPILLSLGVALAWVAGCGLHAKPTTGVTSQAAARTAGAKEPFEPETIRIHPLTRIDTNPETGAPQVDVYFELRDRWNHGVKALGQVVLELYETPGPGSATRGGPLQLRVWKVDLTDPDANAIPYDRVTRTYHISLAGVPTGLPADRDLELRVRFTTLSGETMSGAYRFSAR